MKGYVSEGKLLLKWNIELMVGFNLPPIHFSYVPETNNNYDS